MDATHTLHTATQRFAFGVKERAADEDRRIVARLARGDGRALEELYSRYSTAVFGYLLALTPDRRIGEEVLQDTFVAAWRSASGYQGRSSVRTWLFGIARRRAHDALRRRRLNVTSDEELAVLADPEPGPEESSLAAARQEELTARVSRLAPQHREALTLFFFHDLSHEETAEVLEVPLGTVKSRLSNARRALRKSLEEPEQGER